MNRKQLIDFVNKEITPQISAEAFWTFDIMNTCKVISRWRKGRPAAVTMAATVDDGFLYINGTPAGRIAARAPRVTVSSGAAYWEGRILEKQERGL